MVQNINLKELERKAWRSVFQDGLWDIYLGLLLMAMAIGVLLSNTGMSKVLHSLIYLGLLVLAMLILWAGKRFITLPRLGRVKFGPKGKARQRKARVIAAISVLVGAVLFVIIWLAVKGNWAQGLPLHFIIAVVWVANMLVVFSLGAYFLHYERLYLIGAMYALPLPVDMLLNQMTDIDLTPIVFAVPAAAILVMGLVVLVRFLREYPVPDTEGPPSEGAWHGNH